MIPLALVNAVIGWGVPAKLAKPFVILMAVALLVTLAIGAKKLYDHNVIAKHDLAVEASQAKADRKADNKAAEQRDKDNARRSAETQELNDVIKATPDPVDRKRAFYRCVRLQQAARANGLQPPACV